MSPATPSLPDAHLNQHVDATLVAQAYERQPLSLLMTAVVGPTFVVVFWPYFPGGTLLVWLAVMLLVTLARGAVGRAHDQALRRGPAHQLQHAKRWEGRFVAGAAAAGAAWSLGPLLLLSMTDRTEWMLLALALVSVSAVSSVAMGPLVQAMGAFQCLALMPAIAALLVTGRTLQQLTAAVLGSAMVLLLTVGRRSHATIRSLVETELRRASAVAQAEAASSRALAASRAKSLFLANMSHELRTPLNAVIGAAQLMRAGEQDAAQRRMLADAIERSGHTLLGLIDNILDLSRIEAGALALLPRDFDLSEALDAVAATAGLVARARGLRLACTLDPALHRWRHGDAARVRQLLLNLLGNAVKFTAQGEVQLLAAPGTLPGQVRFQVRDTGIGIAATALTHIFEPFRQADEGADRRYGGSGLGLAIVRELAEAMGGSVAATSVQGQGSCFTLTLPLPQTQAPPAASAPTASRATAGAARPARVLLVEDDALNRTIVASLLEHAGHTVHLAESGPAALDVLRRDPGIQLVLMDWQMPGMDGLEATRRLRAGDAGETARQVPVVALTANAFAEDRDACLAAGMNDYLTKPVHVDRLAEAIARWTAPGGPEVAADVTRPRSGVSDLSPA